LTKVRFASFFIIPEISRWQMLTKFYTEVASGVE